MSCLCPVFDCGFAQNSGLRLPASFACELQPHGRLMPPAPATGVSPLQPPQLSIEFPAGIIETT
jgi:hypothetical protein